MNEHLEWALPSESIFTFAVGFSPTFRRTLQKMAKSYSVEPIIRLKGEKQPYVPVYIGKVRKGKELPSVLVTAILDEFLKLDLGSVGLEGPYHDEVDDLVQVFLHTEHVFEEYYTQLARVLLTHASASVDFTKTPQLLTLGKGLQSHSFSEDMLGYAMETTSPTSMALGCITPDVVFHPYLWVSKTKPGFTYRKGWLDGAE